jgi:HEAT repeat protein
VLGMLSFPVLFPAFAILRSNRDTEVRLAFLEALERLREPHSVGALATAACHNYSQVSHAAERALLAVLPTLTDAHYGQLEADTIPNLCRILDGKRPCYPVSPEALTLAILNAFEKIGDGRAIPSVRHIASASYPACQEAAERLLPILIERQERDKNSGVLLRASEAPVSAPEELLRPAAATTTSAPEQLLRPSASDTSA